MPFPLAVSHHMLCDIEIKTEIWLLFPVVSTVTVGRWAKPALLRAVWAKSVPLPYISQFLCHCDFLQLSRSDDMIPGPSPYPSSYLFPPPPFHPNLEVFYDIGSLKEAALGWIPFVLSKCMGLMCGNKTFMSLPRLWDSAHSPACYPLPPTQNTVSAVCVFS